MATYKKGRVKIGSSSVSPTGTDHAKIHTKGFKDVVVMNNLQRITEIVNARERVLAKRKKRARAKG